ncbi:MAG: DNA mismatch repair protein MutS [Ardenticatenia bacterium]|nr:DNA mismatch repair protein MutS [Ardenticatenia bacterium]
MSADTPMMRQWAQIKQAHPDCLVLFRLGDFYEAFNEDAVRLAEVCEVTLTSRPVKQGARAPMAGVPYHAVDGYIAQLVRRGIKVALVEQTGAEGAPEKRARMSRAPEPAAVQTAPQTAATGGRSIMSREVVRVVTPGTLVEGDLLEARANNWLAAVTWETGDRLGLALIDATTGDFLCTELSGSTAGQRLLDELARLRPAELLHAESAGAEHRRLTALREDLRAIDLSTVLMPYSSWRFDPDNARRQILEHFGTVSLSAYGCEQLPLATGAAGAALAYLMETQRSAARQIQGLATYQADAFLHLDAATRRNLEISVTLRGDKRQGTLLAVLDETLTAMGARRLRAWLDQPLLDLAAIEARHDAVAALAADERLRAALRQRLEGLPDVERLLNRLLAGYGGPRELQSLARGLEGLADLAALLDSGALAADPLASLVDPVLGAPGSAAALPALLRGRCQQDLGALVARVRAALVDPPPAVLGLPGLMREGYDAELDAILDATAGARDWIAGLEARERARTGIKSLKVSYNRVFGYTINISNANAALVPADYERRQTLTGAERYVTPELKAREQEVLSAEERIVAIERRLFGELVDAVAALSAPIRGAALDIAEVDVLACLAEVAVRRRYSRPRMDDSRELEILGGRHPVVEALRPPGGFVPTDLRLGTGEIVLLTGPNMAGKSTVGRQAALILLLAQTGSFVPAEAARIGLADRIFTRIGAQDELAAGRSTFMVEMVETAEILHHATPRSLIILDELGRGTSTYDGMAIAWAVIERIHDHPRLGARTLFATHYHELTSLADRLPRLRNLHMAVAETPRGIAFLHQVLPGAADRSYGIHVAELAGLPRPVVERAWEILAELEAAGPATTVPTSQAPADLLGAAEGQLSFLGGPPAPSRVVVEEHPALERLRRLEVDGMTPMEALVMLDALRREARG